MQKCTFFLEKREVVKHMPKKPDERVALAKEMFLQGTKLVEIASQLDLPEGTVRRWKCTYKWESERSNKSKSERSEKQPKKQKKKKNKGGAPKGNHNATGPPGNQNAVKHGFFCKVLPEETLNIIEDLETLNQLDVLWQNIQIQYAAILRAQRIMLVKESDLENEEETDDPTRSAWSRQAAFLSAQSRAMQTLTSMIKQYDAMVETGMANQEQKARIELLRVQIDKLSDKDQGKKESKVVIVNDLSDLATESDE